MGLNFNELETKIQEKSWKCFYGAWNLWQSKLYGVLSSSRRWRRIFSYVRLIFLNFKVELWKEFFNNPRKKMKYWNRAFFPKKIFFLRRKSPLNFNPHGWKPLGRDCCKFYQSSTVAGKNKQEKTDLSKYWLSAEIRPSSTVGRYFLPLSNMNVFVEQYQSRSGRQG